MTINTSSRLKPVAWLFGIERNVMVLHECQLLAMRSGGHSCPPLHTKGSSVRLAQPAPGGKPKRQKCIIRAKNDERSLALQGSKCLALQSRYTPVINFVRFLHRKQFAKEPGMSYSTFARRLKTLKVKVPKGLLSPATQEAIKKALDSLDDGAASDDKLG